MFDVGFLSSQIRNLVPSSDASGLHPLPEAMVRFFVDYRIQQLSPANQRSTANGGVPWQPWFFKCGPPLVFETPGITRRVRQLDVRERRLGFNDVIDPCLGMTITTTAPEVQAALQSDTR